MMGRLKMLAALAPMMGIVVFVGGCASDDENGNGKDDAGIEAAVEPDTNGAVPDGVTLYDCDDPGMPCNAHDDCAIDPVCGNDGKCHPSGYQNCDDKQPCTNDICLGQGKCAHEPKENTCALPVKKEDGNGSEIKCFAADERHPTEGCKVCDPDDNQYQWTPANGGTCDDDDPCTKDDYCSDGLCKGTSYGEQCQDKFSCTDDVCDGKGGCLGNPLKSDACLINGQCYTDGEKDADGCNICDVKTSQNAWTPLSAHCLIKGKCYQPGETDSTNCSVCDPDKNPNDWTPLPGLCKIDNQCYQKGDVNTPEGGCGECDPALDPIGWSIKGDNCYIEELCRDPGDTDDTGCGECDPSTDKYSWTPVQNTCLIEGICYKPADKDDTGCGECDPAVDAAGWTVKGDNCLISGVCYDPDEQDDTGCAVCDPATSKSSFTPLTNKCLIGRKCYEDQGNDPTNCLMCDYTAAPGEWSPAGQTKVVNYTFEGANATGWTFDNSMPPVKWSVSNRRPASGTYSLYYGDPAQGNYDTPSDENKGSATTPDITLGSSTKAALLFWVWADVEKGTSYDMLEVDVIEGSTPTTVWKKNITDTIVMSEWNQIEVDLKQWAGKTIKISFRFDTVDSVSNKGEGVYIDDITIYHDCP